MKPLCHNDVRTICHFPPQPYSAYTQNAKIKQCIVYGIRICVEVIIDCQVCHISTNLNLHLQIDKPLTISQLTFHKYSWMYRDLLLSLFTAYFCIVCTLKMVALEMTVVRCKLM